MAGKDIVHNAYNDSAIAAYTREHNMWTGGARIFDDVGKSKWEEREEYWSLGLGPAGKMQGGGPDG